MMNMAIHMFEEIGRLSMAAKHYKVMISRSLVVCLSSFNGIFGCISSSIEGEDVMEESSACFVPIY